MTSTKKTVRTCFALSAYLSAVVATAFIIDTFRTPPVDHNRLGLWVVVALVGICVGSLLIRRPRL